MGFAFSFHRRVAHLSSIYYHENIDFLNYGLGLTFNWQYFSIHLIILELVCSYHCKAKKDKIEKWQTPVRIFFNLPKRSGSILISFDRLLLILLIHLRLLLSVIGISWVFFTTDIWIRRFFFWTMGGGVIAY